ncbi:unnamed protein product [Schistosoma haematobium]|nr:unnamed protein product [Schistosoma haematobium]CAH8680295.1 unnamed protein product [Schistosoma haematobium]
MSSPPTPKIEILDDEENIVNLEGEEDTNDKYLSTLSTNDEDLNNYVQLFDLYPQILRKCSREFKKTFGVVNEIEYENGNTFEMFILHVKMRNQIVTDSLNFPSYKKGKNRQ